VSLSRRQFLTGRVGRPSPAAVDVVEQRAVTDLLTAARRRAPWEQPSTASIRAGLTARIDVLGCLAYRGSPCTTCSEHCPAPGAIVIDGDQRPSVDPARCTGCGDCSAACPAPHKAIAIGPEAR